MDQTSTAANTRSMSQQWVKAAVLGSIWAAIEIIAGSFLHNLKVPFAGTLLSMVAVYMLVAFTMHWKERGIIIRAGIIAALMKSISPSAIILGPMVGILMEAVILEFIWLLFGRNMIGFLVGGILAVSWALVQKIITLLIIYGFDVVRIVEAFYRFLVKNTGLEHISPVYMVILVVSIYIVAGMLSALAGYFSFKHVRYGPADLSENLIFEESDNPFGSLLGKQKFASFNLLMILLVLASTLYFLNTKTYIPALITGFGLIAYALIRYKRSIRHLKKVSIWGQLLIITLLAALIWEWISTGLLFTVNGLLIGLEINFRALVIILSFSAISVELRNPVVRSLLYRNGFSNLYKAVSLAFSTLPAIIERLPKDRNLFRQRRRVLGVILPLADELFKYMNRESIPHENIFLVTGKVHGGKSLFLSRLVDLCRENGMHVAGFIAKGTFKNQIRDGFQFTDIASGNSLPLAIRERKSGWLRHKDFYFNTEAFKRGETIIAEGLDSKADVIVLDELGPMEQAGKGWHKAIKKLEQNYDIPQVWAVRERILQEVADTWQIPDRNVYSIENEDFDKLMNQILKKKSDQP